MEIKRISSRYCVRRLVEVDVEKIYDLYIGNPLFFRFCPPQATREGILEDMKALPTGIGYENKYYIGFFNGEKLVAVMDLILGYPNADAAFIGLFMMHKSEQGRGMGSEVIRECLGFLREEGFRKCKLAFAKGNPQSEKFWIKNGFCLAGSEIETDGYTAVPMERML